MADNVISSAGQVIVATKDLQGAQHQAVIGEFISGQTPMPVSPQAPFPTDASALNEIMLALLVEQRVMNKLLYVLVNTESETIEDLRIQLRDLPITISSY